MPIRRLGYVVVKTTSLGVGLTRLQAHSITRAGIRQRQVRRLSCLYCLTLVMALSTISSCVTLEK